MLIIFENNFFACDYINLLNNNTLNKNSNLKKEHPSDSLKPNILINLDTICLNYKNKINESNNFIMRENNLNNRDENINEKNNPIFNFSKNQNSIFMKKINEKVFPKNHKFHSQEINIQPPNSFFHRLRSNSIYSTGINNGSTSEIQNSNGVAFLNIISYNNDYNTNSNQIIDNSGNSKSKTYRKSSVNKQTHLTKNDNLIKNYSFNPYKTNSKNNDNKGKINSQNDLINSNPIVRINNKIGKNSTDDIDMKICNINIEEDENEKSFEDHKEIIRFKGYLYKLTDINKMKKLWFNLIQRDLYCNY